MASAPTAANRLSGLTEMASNRLQEMLKMANLMTRSSSNARTRNQPSFQPQKRPKGSSSWQLKQFAEATLGSGSLRKVVQLPEGEDRNEWLAVNGE